MNLITSYTLWIRTLIATSRKIVTNYFIMEVNGRMGTMFYQKFL